MRHTSQCFAASSYWFLIVACFLAGPLCAADDWPMWRYDAARTASSPNRLPESLNHLWTLKFPPRVPAWDDPLNIDLMTYDHHFEPVAKDGRLFVNFSDQDRLVAYDLHTGKALWSFFADAPVRFAPAVWEDLVFFCSDDGFLYCLAAADGQLQWKYSPAPSSQRAIGNRRLVSAWPARGGPVIRDETVYFAASIWPFMGTFICALDARGGQTLWVNDSTGAQYIKQPHSAPSFAGVAPQGALVATDKHLVVPGGRSVPAVFDRHSGKLNHFLLNEGGKGNGGSFVCADDVHFYVHTREKGTRAFNLETGIKTAFMPNEPVITNNILFAADSNAGEPVIHAYQASLADDKARTPLWSIQADASADLIRVGNHLVAASTHSVSVLSLQFDDAQVPTGATIQHMLQTDFPIARLLVANQTLVVVGRDGSLAAFGANSDPLASPPSENGPLSPPHAPSQAAKSQLQDLWSLGDAQGFAYWYGTISDDLLAALIDNNPFQQIAIISPDASHIDHLRNRLVAWGHYGRITAHHASPVDFRAPQYTGHHIVIAPDLSPSLTADSVRAIYNSLRPYGGVLTLLDAADHEATWTLLKECQLEQATLASHPIGIVARRIGPLPGSADWTHQYGDVANTIKSNDSRVKLPLGILWFGGSSNLDVLPRHGHGPPEQVVDGRLFIEGMNSLSARDVYTGRILWKREFADLGTYDVFFDETYEDTPLDTKYNQVHIPGANARGTNYVVTPEAIYLIDDNKCRMLNPVNGEDIGIVELPAEESGETAQWGYIGVYKDVLIAGLGFAMYRDRYALEIESDKELKGNKAGFGSKSFDRAASRALVGFNRHTGEQLWRYDASHSFWHNGIVAGGDRIYCLDRNPKTIEDAMRRRGIAAPDTYRIVAIDYRTAQPLWEIRENIFGTWLGYSEKHDLLLQAGAKASDRLVDEVGQGMRVYNAIDGSLRWERDALTYSGPCILHNDLIITNANAYSESAGAFSIKTGEQRLVRNTITGKMEPWKITRAYGCNTITASENLLTFRSGAAGYYDLLSDSGTGNLGGFKSGCTSNLVVANGVLNAPDYTRTCSCAYQNQTSLALVHMPDNEVWGVHPSVKHADDRPMIDTLGINFAAPGDRRDPQGDLWVEFPSLSGDAVPIQILINPEAQPFLQHSSTRKNAQLPWVAASGLLNVSEVTIDLRLQSQPDQEKSTDPPSLPPQEETHTYDLVLFFSPPRDSGTTEAEHSFTIDIQDGQVQDQIALVNDKVSPDSESVRSYSGIKANGKLTIRFNPLSGAPFVNGLKIKRRP